LLDFAGRVLVRDARSCEPLATIDPPSMVWCMVRALVAGFNLALLG
jgi:hypothetical protein